MDNLERNPRSFDLLEWTQAPTRTAFIAAAGTRRIPSGGLIYQQGDCGDEMFRIVEGAVRLSVSRGDGKEIIFLFFQKGDCFGVSSLIDGGCRPQTAEAVTPTILQTLDATSFARLREDHRDFDQALLKLVTLQMRVVSLHFIDASLSDLTGRVSARLLEYSRTAPGKPPAVRMPQNELAALVGASRQSVNRVLQQMQAYGLIALDYNTIEIVDQERLRGLADESSEA